MQLFKSFGKYPVPPTESIAYPKMFMAAKFKFFIRKSIFYFSILEEIAWYSRLLRSE